MKSFVTSGEAKRRARWLAVCAACLCSTAGWFVSNAAAGVIVSGGGLTYVEEGPPVAMAGDAAPVNLATGKTAIALDQLDFGVHFITNLNNGSYGNSSSWIGAGAVGVDGPFVGINLGATPIADVQSIAFGRSNVLAGDTPCGGVCTDRNIGLYTLQYTQVSSPTAALTSTGDPLTGWTTIGTIDNQGIGGPSDDIFTAPWQRHRFNFDPVDATGLRLIVPNSFHAVDEIEIYDAPGAYSFPVPIELTPASGFSISWDGNDGDHNDSGAPPTGAVVPNNLALASNGATAFSSSDLGVELSLPYHVANNANDGFYGNINSWIGGDTNPFSPIQFVGVDLGGLAEIDGIAFSRDNGNGNPAGNDLPCLNGQCTDRSLGVYMLQITTDPNPGPLSVWTDLATIAYNYDEDATVGGGFTSFLRHQFDVATSGGGPVLATGVRLLVPATGAGLGTSIDEFEVYGTVVPEPTTASLAMIGALGAVALRSVRRRK